LFFENIQGSFGLDSQSASSVKDLLSSTSIQSHCSVITMGLIPTIKSNIVATSVDSLKPNPKEEMDQLAKLQGSSNSSNKTIAAGAADAKKEQSIDKMNSSYVSAAVSALSEVDKQKNNVINLNSLMTALDDYVKKAGDGKLGGVPINFYLKYVTKRDIALQWMQKYYPSQLFPKPKDDDEDDT
jgi:hypothetical protein